MLARRWRWLAIWLAGQALTLLAYLPWVLGQSPADAAEHTPPPSARTCCGHLARLFRPVPALIGAELGLNIASAIFGLVAVLATAALLIRCRTRAALLLLSQAACSPPRHGRAARRPDRFSPPLLHAGVPATAATRRAGPDCLPAISACGAARWRAAWRWRRSPPPPA